MVSNTGHVETIDASDFKARCLAILDRVQATGERVIILKRGRPVAELLPASRTHAEYPQLELKGTVIVVTVLEATLAVARLDAQSLSPVFLTLAGSRLQTMVHAVLEPPAAAKPAECPIGSQRLRSPPRTAAPHGAVCS